MKSRGITALAVLLFAGLFSLRALASPTANDAQAAFAKLKALEGKWEGKSTDGSNLQLQYEVVSGGSAVVERFVSDKMGHENAMLTVYFLDGGRLLLQHYCMAKNQPRMQAQSYDESTGELRFAFLDATGLTSPADGHMHNATFHFVDAQHVNQEWQFFENGRLKFTEAMQYTRVQ
jgi:hypothetical protein